MIKISKVVCLMSLAGLALTSCQTPVKLAVKGSIDQNEMCINPKSVVGYVGDVMPFYDNGKLNVFYLQDGRNTNLGFHPFALMTTTDFVNYNDYGVVIPFENNIYSQDFALGTGSVIKDKNGLYHCFYTGHNPRLSAEIPYKEKIQHATSNDMINWVKHPNDGFYGGHNDFRDPYVYFDESTNTYSMLITTRSSFSGVIKRYESTDLKTWKDCGIFFQNDSGVYNMECPTFFKYNDYYYLSYSEQGDHRVTRYRYKKNLTDKWIKPKVDYLDDEGFYAGRMEKAFDSLYVMAWCGTKEGEYDGGEFNWAGNLVTHELTQLPNGELRPKIVSNIDKKINNEVEYKQTNGEEATNFEFDVKEQKSFLLEELSTNITKINFKVNFKSLIGDAGISFNTSAENSLSNLIISLNPNKGLINFYNNASDFSNYGISQLSMPFKFVTGKDCMVTILIDGEILTIYIDNEVALTTRMYDMPKASFSFYGNNVSASFKEIKFYE